MPGVPGLLALYHVDNVIVVAPNVFKLLFEGTIVEGNERFLATQLAVNTRMALYGSVKVLHSGKRV